jgi:AraC family transcriptional regulator of adaptative response / DNA-3-methyladenine glycosylase II
MHHKEQAEMSERDRAYYRAVAARDARFDGIFFTGVKTTGIYCRPICGVKIPRASSCLFFSTAAAAEAGGFRPCLRCRPELAPYALQQNLAHAVWKKIAAGAMNEQSAEALADEVGLSSRQLRRVLLDEFGVTPIELAQTQRLLFAKKLLQETQLSMTGLAYAAGFGSVRRFNALFEARYKMTPSTIRRTSQINQDSLVLRLAYRPPYAWDAMLNFLRSRAMPGLEAADANTYRRSVRVAGKQGWISVTHRPEKQQLALQVAPELASVLMPLLAQVRDQFDVEANPQMIESHLQSDALLAAQMTRVPGLRVPGAFEPFELAIRAVLGQQVSVAGATTIAGRLVKRFGTAIETPFADVTHHFPTPQQLVQCAVEEIAALGMPKSRAATVQNVAAFALAGGLQKTAALNLDQLVRNLRTVTGIGEWTAQYIAMRALRYSDAFPAGDLGLQKAAAVAPDTRISEKQLLQRAQQWSPWRSYAALLLWQSLN